MSLTKLTENLNIIQGLADKPTETASDLKEKFDEAGNIIKNHINNTLTTELDTLITSLQNAVQTLQTTVQTNRSTLSTEQLNILFPVGYIYISASSTNPSSSFGGTWEQIKDRFLLSAGDTYEAGSTGGEATHTLTIDEMPSHTHSIRVSVNGSTGGGERVIFQSKGVTNDDADIGAGDTLGAGNGLAHNNMPPYLAVYVWKRTA